MRFFSEKNSIFRPKISDDLFSVLNVVYDPFFTRKTTISKKNSLIRPFSYYVSRASDNTTSLNIGGNQCMGRPPPQIWRTVPSVPLGLRPWYWGRKVRGRKVRIPFFPIKEQCKHVYIFTYIIM